MKAISIALKTLLSTSNSLLGCDLYTLTLANGTILRYTDTNIPITFGGFTFAASLLDSAPGFERSSVRCALGLQAETMEIDILYDGSTLIQGVTPGAFANAGGFDGARISVDKLLTDDFANTTRGVVNVFSGLVSGVQAGSTRVILHAATDLIYLNSAFPRNYYLPACNHALFDAGCGLVKSVYAISGTVTGGTAKHISSALAQADGFFALGYVVMTSGANLGLQRSVKAFSGGGFDLLYPFPVACANGDTFTGYPGCDKTQTTCTTKFANAARFRGFPYVPPPETVVNGMNGQSPGRDSTGDGGGIASIGRGPGGQKNGFQQF
jgi:uncharacterized phage protein (TIGR02218 family)